MRKHRFMGWFYRGRKAPSLWTFIWRGSASPTIYVISFPKCGRTWLRLILGYYLAHRFGLDTQRYLDVNEFHKINPSIPKFEFYHDDKPYKRTPDELDESKKAYRRDKVIFLARDPRDVVVSRFFSIKYREKKYSGDIHDFLREDRGSLSTLVKYYNIWMQQRKQPKDFILITYEQLYQNSGEQLLRILDFVGFQNHDTSLLTDAVNYGRFENMRRLEERDLLQNTVLRPTEQDDIRSYKTRKGIIGDHRNLFNDDDLAYADCYIKEHLHPEFGYGEATKRIATRERDAR